MYGSKGKGGYKGDKGHENHRLVEKGKGGYKGDRGGYDNGYKGGKVESYDDYYDPRDQGYDSWGGGVERPLRNNEDRIPRIAEKLGQLRETLPECAAKAYHALQLALRPHARSNGSAPDFDREFHDNLRVLFPNAWEIDARQIGSWNQWEVRVDGSPQMYCSVRLECLGDNPQFVRDLKQKARVVKDTLLENGAQWKGLLQSHGGRVDQSKISQFEELCHERVQRADYEGGQGERGKGKSDGGNRWVEKRDLCSLCRRPKEEDMLNGVHMCIVFATFSCQECRYSWTSHHGRLRPDGESLMGQECSRCKGRGLAKDWKINDKNRDQGERRDREDRDGGGGDKQRGMHQSDLCEACQTYGNCMGVFYDPFVLTTALGMLCGQQISWRPFSDMYPELLIADCGPDMQVCLQPHVHIAAPQNERSRSEGLSGRRVDRGLKSGEKGGAWDRDYDRGNRGDHNRGDSNREDFGRGQGEQWSGRRPVGEQRRQDGGSLASRGPAASGGVKDQALLDKFLGNPGGGPRNGGDWRSQGPPAYPPPQPSSQDIPPRYGGAAGSQFQPEPPQQFLSQPAAWSLAGDEAGGGPAVARGGAESSWLQAENRPEAPDPQKVPSLTKSKFNKIGAAPASGGQVGKEEAQTPLLDALPPLRRAQFLQIVLRQVKSSGGEDTQKFVLAEEFLVRNHGDYDLAYQHVKALSDGVAAS